MYRQSHGLLGIEMLVCQQTSPGACQHVEVPNGSRRLTWSAASLAARTTLMKLPWLVAELTLSMSKLSPD